jgi:UDP-N-acetyl-2-amino-2-deoxyglucuronate dehydrogenase
MPETRPKRVCIIGVGGIARVYGAALKELSSTVNLVAACCRSEEKGQAYAAEFGCKWYSSYDEMLDSEKPDVALVTTPSGFHLEPTLACAERKVHVLCDKPLEITTARCDEMIAACDAAGVSLGCIFQVRLVHQ